MSKKFKLIPNSWKKKDVKNNAVKNALIYSAGGALLHGAGIGLRAGSSNVYIKHIAKDETIEKLAGKYKKEFANEIMNLKKAVSRSSESPEKVEKYKKQIAYYSSCIKKIDDCKTVSELRKVLAAFAVKKATKRFLTKVLSTGAGMAVTGAILGAQEQIERRNKIAEIKKDHRNSSVYKSHIKNMKDPNYRMIHNFMNGLGKNKKNKK